VSEPSSPRSTTDWLLDLCVYAPIGFALEAHKYLPEFADRGRNQVALARFVGKFAVDRLEKQFGPLATFLRTDTPGSAGQAPPSSASSTGSEPTGAEAPAAGPDGPVVAVVEPVPSTGEPVASESATSGPIPDEPVPDEDVPDEAGLALHGYGTLSASQIVPRLATLGRSDLEAIARFERANRARRTILNRIDQLLARR